MVKEIRYTSIKRILDAVTEHPMMSDVTLEQVVRHTIRFIGIFGLTRMYQDKEVDVSIHEFRGELPCDLISIIQVKDGPHGICLRSMTDSFTPGMLPPPKHNPCPPHKEPHHHGHFPYIPPLAPGHGEPTFKTQGRIIFTSFPEGRVRIAYKAIPVDEDGFPLLMDNENYLAALEAYIKKQVFTVKFDQGKISAAVLQNAQAEYSWLAGQLNSEFIIPSMSEMQSITNMITALIPRMREFDKGFRDLGQREYIKNH